ncbi:MAG: toprim domain-containing protein [Candidatus Thermoplasmatota archaeon]
MLTPEERLGEILEVLDDLEDLSADTPIIVEGLKDASALRRLGVRRNVVTLGKGLTVFAFCERLSERHGRAVVMTDWDRKGGKLARMLKEGLEANGARADTDLRARLVLLVKKDIKDIEGLPAYVERLRAMAGRT